MKSKFYLTHILAAVAVLGLARLAPGLSFWILLVIAVIIGLTLGDLMWGYSSQALSQIAVWAKNVPGNPSKIMTKNPDLLPIAEALKDACRQFSSTLSELVADKQRAELILNNMRDGVILTDTKSRVVLANPAAAAIFRLEPDQLVGRPLIYSINSQELDKLISQVIAKGEEAEAQIEIFMPRERRLRTVALPVYDNQSLSAVLTVFQDVTSGHRVNAVRRDFVANVSHELKTPVAGINLLADSLKTSVGVDDKTAKKFATKLAGEAKLLSQLTSDLLDLSELETPELKPLLKPVTLTTVIKKVVGGFTETAAAKGLSLRTDLPRGLARLNGNEDQLRLMLRNLVENAIHYTQTGGDILISASVANNFIVLEVTDTGIGIPTSDLNRVFERFYRVDRARSRRTGGTGLGLSIVKHVVENHDGRVKLKSTVGVGSTFTIFFPAIKKRKTKK